MYRDVFEFKVIFEFQQYTCPIYIRFVSGYLVEHFRSVGSKIMRLYVVMYVIIILQQYYYVFNKYLPLFFVSGHLHGEWGQSWRRVQVCDCKCDRLWVRCPFKEMKYLIFSLVSRQSASLFKNLWYIKCEICRDL